ncbi:MAG TPA: hypothetical protein VLA36_06750 [Longimicrobiales bacterium]|nr:hypothetical protein [Longimicrobiales bacterium]
MRACLVATRIVLTLAVLAMPLAGQERRLGSLTFPNSGAPQAQAAFIQGVLLLHSFEFEDAATEFREAQKADPTFAMAYWGEAMTYNHPLWREQDGDAARAVLGRYAPTPEARARKAPTERERGYLQAVDVLYGPGDKAERDRKYMEAMADLSARYPDDLEARAFHALAILGSTDGERDFATYMRGAATAQPVFEANPLHPGAVHYLIHSFDDPVHAPLGLNAARAYSEIAPDAGHAQHMTSHIFVAMGLWDDVVAANIRARNVQNARLAELGRQPNVCGHYTSWLHYGWLMTGQSEDAEEGMRACLDRVRAGGRPDELGYYANMRARHVFDTEDWEAADRLGIDFEGPLRARAEYDFVSAFAYYHLGRTEGAEALHAGLRRLLESRADEQPRLTIMVTELDALAAVARGDGDQAVALLRSAADLEATLPFEFGPPASPKPPHELLAEVLLGMERTEEAETAFREALSFTPGRTPSTRGLAQARAALSAGR